MNAFGHTPDTVEGKAAQINLALSAGDSVMAAAVVCDQAKDCQSPRRRTILKPMTYPRTQTWPRLEVTDSSSSWRR